MGENKSKKLITILVPAYNEEDVLHMLYERLEKIMEQCSDYNFEILLVNDGSKDKTFSIMQELREKDKRVCYLNLSRNYGKETAMIAGLDYAKGDAVVIIDADLQDPPELIPEMIKYWEQPRFPPPPLHLRNHHIPDFSVSWKPRMQALFFSPTPADLPALPKIKSDFS